MKYKLDFWKKFSSNQDAIGIARDALTVVLAVFLIPLAVWLSQPTTIIGLGLELPGEFLPLALSILVASAFTGRTQGEYPRWLNLLFAVCGAIALFGPPMFVLIGAMLLLGGVAGLIPRRPLALPQGWFMGAGFATIGLFASNLYTFIVGRIGTVTIAPGFFAPFFSFFGYDASASGGHILLSAEGTNQQVLPSPDKFGGEFAFTLLVCLIALSVFWKIPWKRSLAGLGIFAGYAICRFLWLVDLSIRDRMASDWFEPQFVASSYVPLILLLVLVLRSGTVSQEAPKRLALRSGLALAGALLMALGFFITPSGGYKKGNIVIDESHSRWEWSEVPLDNKLFGVKTVYSYYDMMQVLGKTAPVVRNFGEIDDALLKDTAVLILKTPTRPYDQKTLAAIDRFIRNGGGVWAIGDHTDIFGMDSYLNSVTSRYGSQFVGDAVVDPLTNRQLYEPEISAHPIVQHLPTFLWYTSCSIASTRLDGDLICSANLLKDSPDYSKNTFFGDFAPSISEQIGPVLQAQAFPVGQGRLALWSDSTLFSNFSIFLPGKLELATGYVDWLRRENGSAFLKWGMFVTGVALCGVAFAGRWAYPIPAMMACGVLGGQWIAGLYHQSNYPMNPKKDQFSRVAYLDGFGATQHIPITQPEPDEKSDAFYLSAFIAAQRLGRMSQVIPSVDRLTNQKALVLMHSHRDFSQAEVDKIANWVKAGGRLILLDAASGNLDYAKKLLAPFNVRFESLPVATFKDEGGFELPVPTDIVDYNKNVLRREVVRFGLTGVIALLKSKEHPVVGVAKYGKGSVFVSSTSSLFSDDSLGKESEVPNRPSYALLNMLFTAMGGPERPEESLNYSN